MIDLYAPLFRPLVIGALSLRNRIAMAPMTRRKSPGNQAPTDATAAYYARRAAGGVGLIITEGTHIDPTRRADTADVPAIVNDTQEAAWRRVTDRVNEASGGQARIALQLWHTGRHALDPLGPSAVPAPKRGEPGGFKPTPRAMTRQDLDDVRSFYAQAATRAQRAGFDAVEIHGAHTYLLDTFLSPAANQRTDEYGGSFENRMRFPLEVARAVRAAVGPRFPVLYRFSRWKFDPAEDLNFPDTESLAVWVRALREAGVNVLHASTPDATEPAYPGSRLSLAGWTRELSGLPTIAVGRISVSSSMTDTSPVAITDPAPAAALIDRGEADLIAVGRALIANPDWCELVRAGRWRELKPYSRALLESLA